MILYKGARYQDTWNGGAKYRLYTEVQVSTLFIQPRAEGPMLCKLRRDQTEVHNGLVPWAVIITMHPHPSNDSAGYKSQLKWHPATVRIVMKKLASIKRLTIDPWPKACFEVSQQWLAR